jgi:hypothetical protein
MMKTAIILTLLQIATAANLRELFYILKLNFNIIITVLPQIGRLVVGFRNRFDSRSGYVKFVVDKVALGRNFYGRGKKIFLISTAFRPALRAEPASSPMRPGVSFPGGKANLHLVQRLRIVEQYLTFPICFSDSA